MFFFLNCLSNNFLNFIFEWTRHVTRPLKFERQLVSINRVEKNRPSPPQPSLSYEHIEIATNEAVERRDLGMGPRPVVMENP